MSTRVHLLFQMRFLSLLQLFLPKYFSYQFPTSSILLGESSVPNLLAILSFNFYFLAMKNAKILVLNVHFDDH